MNTLFLIFSMTWQGRKVCEDKTAICGISVEYQDWRGPGYRGLKKMWAFALNVVIDGIKFKCCPIGKINVNKKFINFKKLKIFCKVHKN